MKGHEMTTSNSKEKPVAFLGQNNVTVRVPLFVKAELGEMVKGEEIITNDEFIVIDKIARAVKHRGL